MITKVRIQNYKALRDVTLELTPIHVLIGPNDSGKTSILEAIAALCRSVDHPLSESFTGAWQGQELFWQGKHYVPITISTSINAGEKRFEYELSVTGTPQGRSLQIAKESGRFTSVAGSELKAIEGYPESKVHYLVNRGQKPASNEWPIAVAIYNAICGVQLYKWDARFLALPVAPDLNRKFQMEFNGFGLALCLDNILGYDRERFGNLESQFKSIFPDIRSIKLVPEPAFKAPVDAPEQIPILNRSDGKGLYFEFEGVDSLIPARQVSDGVLLVLAYLAVLYQPDPPSLLLVEEPENGIHPKRIVDVLGILKELIGSESFQTQVILTTHSPYVVDLFDPSEVTLCKKGADGATQVQRLSESKTVSEQLDVFTLGEIWTAEGDNALLSPVISGGE